MILRRSGRAARGSGSALRKTGLSMAAAVLGVAGVPSPAQADGPGYGGDADALTVHWQSASGGDGLAVYALGFRGGAPVRIRVGSADECTVTADPNGAVRMVVTLATCRPVTAAVTALIATTNTGTDAVTPGASVLVAGHTPAGELRTLVGAVPPVATGTGVSQLVPAAVALTVLCGGLFWARRRFAGVAAAELRRYRRPARHRA